MQTYVMRLRPRDPGGLGSETGGYELAVIPAGVGAVQFEQLTASGRRDLATATQRPRRRT
ncbi:hypothetical protein GCM10009557_33430 [Virgisporangium ochraceum]|uniref:Uncharacterized protein n=1 Tax=Virgisporangium ochraceum TaxID=65505 RepID=A0A8J4A5L1_9ACTN|nr:hypothetical protein Voc01_104430 [Virgisporangium ochraceum]